MFVLAARTYHSFTGLLMPLVVPPIREAIYPPSKKSPPTVKQASGAEMSDKRLFPLSHKLNSGLSKQRHKHQYMRQIAHPKKATASVTGHSRVAAGLIRMHADDRGRQSRAQTPIACAMLGLPFFLRRNVVISSRQITSHTHRAPSTSCVDASTAVLKLGEGAASLLLEETAIRTAVADICLYAQCTPILQLRQA